MDTRDRLIDAAARVMRQQGLSRTTVKEIARAAGFSEGALYKHFASKEALFLAVLTDRLPPFVALTNTLPNRAGQSEVAATLREVARLALAFFSESVPIAVSVVAEHDLLERHLAGMQGSGAGPHRPNEAVATYLEAERALGRIRPDAHPGTVAGLLLGACFQRVFLRHYLMQGESAPEVEERFVEETVETLWRGIEPGEA